MESNAPKFVNNKKSVDLRRWPGVLYYESKTKRSLGKTDICFYIRYTLPDGKKQLEKVGWKSEGYSPQIAAEIRADRIRKNRHGEAVKTRREISKEFQQQNKTINEIAESYFKTQGAHLKGLKVDMSRYEKHIKPNFGKKPTRSITPLDIEKLKATLHEKADATKANTLEILRRIINYGINKQLSPALGFKIKIPRKNNEVTEYLKPDETKNLFNILDTWPSQDVSRMLKLAFLTGMRRGEIFRLQDSDLDFHQNLIMLRDPKGGDTVSIPMSQPVKELLESQLAWRKKAFPDSGYAFPGKGGNLRTDCSAVDRIKQKAQLPAKFRIFHGMRHHFAVTLANSGDFSIDLIGKLLTHKSAAMTQRYAQFLPETMKKVSDNAAELLLKQRSGVNEGK